MGSNSEQTNLSETVLNGYSVKYLYEVYDVGTRRKLLSGNDTKIIQPPPFAVDDRGELEIHLETRCRLSTYYELRQMVKGCDTLKHFIGDSIFSVRATLISYVDPSNKKEIIIGH